MANKGIRILDVRRGSRAEKIGLAPGDRILDVNGRDVPDEIALRFFLSEDIVDLHVRHPDGTEKRYRARLSEDSDWGVTVEEFRTKTCNNACLFCFVDRLPPGVRPALRVKDDDYRLSFLHGNYITLTNLSAEELDRIVEQRLSPLYVSVHATDPLLRARILGRKKPDDLDGKLRRLVKGGVRLHTQIVLMPGLNDGRHLEKTVFDLYSLHPGVQSVAIVPVGLSDYGMPGNLLEPVTPAFSRRVVRRTAPWQARFRRQSGRTFVYLADEFYVLGGLDIPHKAYYDDFAQIENGVGMVRLFLDGFEKELRRHRRSLAALRGTLVTGRLFYPILRECVRRFNAKFGSRLQVCGVENRFLGRRITVAGLLAGGDIIRALKGRRTEGCIILPQDAVSQADGVLLDDISLEDLSQTLGRRVCLGGPDPAALFRMLFSS